MVSRFALLLVLVAAAAGQEAYTEAPAAPAVTAAAAEAAAATEAAPVVEVVEDVEEAAPAEEAPAEEAPAEEAAPAYTAAPPAQHAEPSYGYQQQSYGYQQPSYGHQQPSYGHQQPSYGHQQLSYGHQQPSYGHQQPAYGHQAYEPAEPACAANTTKDWCLEDSEYPAYHIAQAIGYHHYTFLSLYQDVVANTSNSVDRLEELDDETYLCSSQTAYVQPLRAKNTDGKWRVIVNNVQVHYDTYTQTARVEECLSAGEPCPLVPHCYESSCLQKSVYHRFLIYDAYDYYLPFAIETFKLPSACACYLGAYEITH